jgi:hypothetical protein
MPILTTGCDGLNTGPKVSTKALGTRVDSTKSEIKGTPGRAVARALCTPRSDGDLYVARSTTGSREISAFGHSGECSQIQV